MISLVLSRSARYVTFALEAVRRQFYAFFSVIQEAHATAARDSARTTFDHASARRQGLKAPEQVPGGGVGMRQGHPAAPIGARGSPTRTMLPPAPAGAAASVGRPRPEANPGPAAAERRPH